ncbi:MAG: carboxypeptidase regulatory-like domain-containing protein, partial [Elusimicrobia bacterium]|nr:carboxypeptidase regulatory-like domain-containing protein [Elusimicrobiota bacterium]
MRRFFPSFILFLLMGGAAPSVSAVDWQVIVRNFDNTLIQGATVYGIVFGTNGPDISVSTWGVTNSTGQVALSLTSNKEYHIVAEKHGFRGSLREQLFSSHHPRVWSSGTLFDIEVRISSQGVQGYGIVVGSVTNATPDSILFGNVNRISGDKSFEVNFGLCRTDNTGKCDLYVVNIPTAAAGTYQMGAYDPANTSNESQCVPQNISSTIPENGTAPVNLNFSICGMTTQTSGGSSSLQAALEGVVTSTDATKNPVSWTGIEFEFKMPGNNWTDRLWANTDQNGRFQLYGLTAGVTYYTHIHPGCAQNGICYDGHDSTVAVAGQGFGNAPGINDFFYDGTRIIKRFVVDTFAGATGAMDVYVKDQNGNPLPTYFWISGDWDNWEMDPSDGTCGDDMVWNSGRSRYNVRGSTGYVHLENMIPGNYRIQGWTQFSNQPIIYNGGADGEYTWGNHCGTDDLRVFIDTTAAVGQQVDIYNSSGTAVALNISSVTIIVNTSANTTGRLTGTVSFPQVVDLSQDPIAIFLRPNVDCSNSPCPPGGYTIIRSSGASSYNYDVFVGSGIAYEFRVESGFWGWAREGEGQWRVDFTSTGTVSLNMKFKPAGKVKGVLKTPTGAIFTPCHQCNPSKGASASFEADNSWGWAEISDNGDFTVGGLLPGIYRSRVWGWGDFPHALSRDQKQEVLVEVNTMKEIEIQLVDGVGVSPQVSTTSLPSLIITTCTAHGETRVLHKWAVQTFSEGTVFTQQNFLDMLEGEWDGYGFEYVMGFESWCQGGGGCVPGFRPKRIPEGVYKLALVQKGEFSPGGTCDSYMYFSILNSSDSVIIDGSLTTGTTNMQGAQVPAIFPNLTPVPSLAARGNAVLRGSATATNIFRQSDFEALGGDFEKFMKFIPLVAIYDTTGTVIAGGMITPAPSAITDAESAQLDQAIATGDWSLFRSVLQGFGQFAYEIRGLPPNICGKVVFSTPNYPYISKDFCLAGDGSIKTLHVNFDTETNGGATLSGVVRSTSGVLLEGAAVQLEGESYGQRGKLTNASGIYEFPGLPAGTYRITVVAGGYVPAVERVSITGSGSVTQNFSLLTGNGIIKGTVYEQTFPFLKTAKNADVFCYDDTYNGNNPTRELYLYKTNVSTVGAYAFNNLIPGDTYRCTADVEGKYSLGQTAVATVSPGTVLDFKPDPKPPTIQVSCRARVDIQTVRCIVNNPSDFEDGDAWYHPSTQTFSEATATKVPESYISDKSQGGDNKLFIDIPFADLADDVIYNLHIRAITASDKTEVTRDVQFSEKNASGSASKDIDRTLIGDSSTGDTGIANNSSCLDDSGGNSSCLQIPAGSVIELSSAIPALSFEAFDLTASTVAAKVNASTPTAFASDIYHLEISSVNFTNRGLDLCLAYDKNATDLTDAAIYRFNPTTNQWEIVEGQQTINPIKGTVCVRIRDLSGVGVSSLGTLDHSGNSPLRALFDGQKHVINPLS